MPTALGHKVQCDGKPQSIPPGTTTPTGPYSCPSLTVEAFCPGNVPGSTPGGTWQCVPMGTTYHCEQETKTSSPSGTTTSMMGWDCQTSPNGGKSCYTADCTSRETTCRNGTPSKPPLTPPSGNWVCAANEFGTVCTSIPPRGSQVCPTLGMQRWCDGAAYCAWGKQTCVNNTNGSGYVWGPCIEGNPRNPPNDAPDTTCSCYFPAAYNPQCCEDPNTCVVKNTRQVPCAVATPALCSPCQQDNQCGSGMVCAYKQHTVRDTPQGGATLTTLEQFCTKSCNTAADCGDAYICALAAGTRDKLCIPKSGTCVP